MLVVYNLLLLVLFPFWVPWMFWRASRRKQKVDWSQRTGAYDLELREGSTRFWIHAVSVGEVISTTPLIRALREEFDNVEIILSSTTSSGYEAAQGLPEGLVDHVVYFPIDLPRFVLRALVTVKPKAVLVMETELWLNFVWTAKQIGIKTAIVNGRISDRAYPRMRSVRPYYRTLFKSIDRVWTQTERDCHRFEEFGAQEAATVGNCKFDQVSIDGSASASTLRAELAIPVDAKVLVVGSTRGADEEALIIDVVGQLKTKDVYIVHAPRHLETAPGLAEAVKKKFGSVAMRSKGETGKYLVLDTYGELGSMYAVADVAIVGGAFEDFGGQNIIQPLAFGKPVIHGPNIQNFRDVADLADRASASITCNNAHDIAYHLDELFGDDHLRETMSASALQLVRSQQGVCKKYAGLVRDLVSS